MPTSAHYALNSFDVKLLPLSVTMMLGTPNRKTMPLMKLTSDAASAEVTSTTSPLGELVDNYEKVDISSWPSFV
jgi:hypothetical protein